MAHSPKYQDVLIKPGMDEAIDPRMLPMGTPSRLENVRTRTAARFDKRPGTTALVATGLQPTGYAAWMGDWNGQPVAAVEDARGIGASPQVYAYGGGRWNDLGDHSHAVPLRRFGLAGGDNASLYKEMDATAANGLIYAAYVDIAAAELFVTEATPEGTVLRTLQLPSERSPRLVWTGELLLLVTNASATVKVRTIDLTDFTTGAATNLATAANGSSTILDTYVPESGAVGPWLLCYATSSTNLKVIRLADHTITFQADITTTSTPDLYCVAGIEATSIVAAYADGQDAQATIFSWSLTGASEITLQTATGSEDFIFQFVMVPTDTDEYAVLMGGLDSAPKLATPFTYWERFDTAGTQGGATKLWHFAPASKPMRVGPDGDASVYAWCTNGIGDWDDLAISQGRHVLVKFRNTAGGPQVAGISYEHQARVSSGTVHVAGFADLGDGRYAVPLSWGDPGKFCGVDCAVFTLAGPETSVSMAHRHTENSGGALFVSGAALGDVSEPPHSHAYMIAENNFAHAPMVSITLATGGSMTAGQAYRYLACFRRIDGLGRVTRSAGSIVATGVVATGTYTKVNAFITTLGVSNRWGLAGEPVVAELYRSWDGGPFYYHSATTSVEPSTTGIVLVADTSSDLSLIDDDGTFDDTGAQNEPPSGARLIKTWGTRMAAVGWREDTVQVSKTYRSDTTWDFTDDDAFRVRVPDPITALGWMDGAGVIFTAKTPYIVTGDGPDDRGNGFFSDPRPLPTVCGADSPHVVETNEGLMYRGGGTIWLMPRGFGPPVPVGDAIQNTLTDYPYLRAAFRAVNTDDDCTHFVLASSDLPAATTLVAVYDNRYGSWSLDDIAGEVGAAAAVDGEFHWMLPSWDVLTDLPVRQFDISSFKDLTEQGAATFIRRTIEMGDWRPNGVMGQGRLCRVGVLAESSAAPSGFAPKLNAVVTVDGSAETVRQFSMDAADGTGLFREIVPTTQAGTAHQLTIYDSPVSGFQPTHAINSFGIETEQQPGMRRAGSGETA
jgi:hypothetical protein